MLEEFHALGPYALKKEEKEQLLFRQMLALTRHHRKNCRPYADFLDALGFCEKQAECLTDIPFFPVRLFKEFDLKSIPSDEVFKVMTSSGTTGQSVSKIYLDRQTAMLQQKVMVRILGDYIGKKRIPMLMVDTPSVLKNREMFSARGAAMIGLRMMARDMVFALHGDMSLNMEAVEAFLAKHGTERFLVFGFTFMVWQHLYKALLEAPKSYDFSNAVLMTGGGWKKLADQAVTTDGFKEEMTRVLGVTRFLDHYGMVEQTGCIYTECEYGHLHASIYSDVLVRNPQTFQPCRVGERGIIQVFSALPYSYPGHSLLTEDVGVIPGEDDCPCGRKGKYIRILGRLKSAELRGCSDTYAEKFR